MGKEDAVEVGVDERQPARRQEVVGSSSGIHHHYHGPVNHVERAYNGNFGTNYGSVNQSTYQSTSSVQLDGISPGQLPLSMAVGGPPRHKPTGLLDPILDASHARNMKLSPPNSQCFPGTRQGVIRDIKTWASSELDPSTPHSLWIFGYAGCGKSAIAQAMAKEFARRKLLAGSFFFFRGSGDRSRAVRFAATVASQLAFAIPEAGVIIETVLKANPGLATTETSSLNDQFESLIYEPIVAVARKCRAPFLIVLDGVDECQDRDDISSFIENMLQFFDEHRRIPLRFLITSRVEDHLHQVLHSSSQVRLLNLVERTTNEDIAAALDAAIADAKRGRLHAFQANWPSASDREQLVSHIGKSFIFMATLIKVLFRPASEDGLTPMDRLPQLLEMKADFDFLYKEILTPHQGIKYFHFVISTIALAYEPLTIAQIADMLKIDPLRVVNVLIHLHAIIQVPDDDRTPVTIWHTSLRDFLCNEDRSGSLSATKFHDCRMALRCIRLAAPGTATQVAAYSRRYALQHLSRSLVKFGTMPPHKVVTQRCMALKRFLELSIFENGYCALEVACRTSDWALTYLLVELDIYTFINFHEHDTSTVSFLYILRREKKEDLCRRAESFVKHHRQDEYHRSYGLPIADAAYSNNVVRLNQILECGATSPNDIGGFYRTALSAACANRSLEALKLLLERGADPNLEPYSNWGPPLYHCARWGHLDLAQILLEHGANPDIRDREGRTPLHAACYEGHIEMVELLLKFKANATIKDRYKETPLERARARKEGAIVEMLEQYCASERSS